MTQGSAFAWLGFGLFGVLVGCGGESPTPDPEPAPKVEPEEPAEPQMPVGPAPALLISQAQFVSKPEGGIKPGPAKLMIYRSDGAGNWFEEKVEDEGSNVFHKAVGWREGILTIAAGQISPKGEPPNPAQLRHWTPDGEGWKASTLWEKAWAGKFQRLRDFEFGDLDGDGTEEIAIATHDMGVVAVGTEKDGVWTVVEFDEKPDTFVHEIEIGDVDGDGKNEFYATPSARNKASGESQPGGVVRYDFKDGGYVRTSVAEWDVSHAKEILVADMNGDGADELYVAREGHVEGKGKNQKLIEPVKIIRMDYANGKYTEVEVASIDDQMCRFLVPGDANHDGKPDIVAAMKKAGLWLLTPKADGTFAQTLIDKKSGGFEHATHVADLDGDGKQEIYVAADDQKQIRKYEWNGTAFDREVVADIPPRHITWNIQDAKL
jgi:hypothetical protein